MRTIESCATAAHKRHDGWTSARRQRFFEVLAATRSVTTACSAAEMSREGAYRLRRREPDGFALAWDQCLARASHFLRIPKSEVHEGHEIPSRVQFHQLRTASAEQREAWAAAIRRASGSS